MRHEDRRKSGAADDSLEIFHAVLKLQALEFGTPPGLKASPKVNCPAFPTEIGKMSSPWLPGPTAAPQTVNQDKGRFEFRLLGRRGICKQIPYPHFHFL